MKKSFLSILSILFCLTILLSACGAPAVGTETRTEAEAAEGTDEPAVLEGIFRNEEDISLGLTVFKLDDGSYEVFADIGGMTMPGTGEAAQGVITAKLNNYLSDDLTVVEIRQNGDGAVLTVVDPAGAEGLKAGDTFSFVPGLPDYAETPVETVRFEGLWYDQTSQRASMRIEPYYDEESNGSRYSVEVLWGSSAWETSVWRMTAEYDEETGELRYEDGARADVKYRDDGSVEEEKEIWTDARGTIRAEDGLLFWTDSNETEAEGMRFERYVAPDVTPEQFENDFFRAAIVEQGTAGSSLKEAQAVCAILSFARTGDFWSCDVPTMRDNMLTAWERLPQEIQTAFDETFYGGELWSRINEVFEDFESVRGVYDDAGVGEEMERLVNDKNVKLSWNTLLPNLFTMGNSES